jgi:dihydrofolate reductase
MRKIINSTYISLDGVVEMPHTWPSIERPSDGRGDEIQTNLLNACDAVLMGRRTYESFVLHAERRLVCAVGRDNRCSAADARAAGWRPWG